MVDFDIVLRDIDVCAKGNSLNISWEFQKKAKMLATHSTFVECWKMDCIGGRAE